MKKLLLILGLLVLLAVASASSERKVALKAQKDVATQTIHTACSNVATSVCANHEGKDQVDCHTGVKETVKTYLKTVKKTADEAIKKCQCSEKASNQCTQSNTATDYVTSCQSQVVIGCSKNCLANSNTYHKTVEKKSEKLLKRICGEGDVNGECKQAVKSHCDEATHNLKTVSANVVAVKVLHKTYLSEEQKSEKQIKKVIINKHKKVIKKTITKTCDKVAKVVCAQSTGTDYVACHKNAVVAVKHYLKRVEHKTKKQVKSCQHKDCVKDTVKVNTYNKKTSEIVALCAGDQVCANKVTKHCDSAVKKVKKVVGKIHVVKVTKVTSHIQKKAVKHDKKQIKKTITNTCDKVTKYVCSEKTGHEFNKCHKKVVTVVKKELKKAQLKTKLHLKLGQKIVHKKAIKIVNLCDNDVCRKKVKDHCDEAVKKVNKLVVKIHKLKKVQVTKKVVVDHKKVVIKKIKKTLIKKEQKSSDKVVVRITKKIVKVACAQQQGKHFTKCHNKVKKAVKKFYKKVQKQTKTALKTCGCEVKATHECSNTATATQTITDCQSSYIKVCSKTCLKDQTHKIEKKTEKLIKKVCKYGKQVGDHCVYKVQKQTVKVVETAKKVQIKVHVVKKVHLTKKVLIQKVEKAKQKIIVKKVVGKTIVVNKQVEHNVVVDHEVDKVVHKKVLVDKVVQSNVVVVHKTFQIPQESC
jgi:hypothetical protein